MPEERTGNVNKYYLSELKKKNAWEVIIPDMRFRTCNLYRKFSADFFFFFMSVIYGVNAISICTIKIFYEMLFYSYACVIFGEQVFFFHEQFHFAYRQLLLLFIASTTLIILQFEEWVELNFNFNEIFQTNPGSKFSTLDNVKQTFGFVFWI